MASVGGPTSGGGFGPLVQPVDEAMTINGGMATVFSRDVELDLFCKFAGEVQVANGTDPTGEDWVPYVDRLSWELSAGDGSKVVSARFRAYEGNYSQVVQATTYMVASATPTGASGLCMYNLAWLLANCPSFQAWRGVVSPSQALAYIHRYMYPEPLDWPFILISEVPLDNYLAEGGGAGYSFINQQQLYVSFEAQPEVDVDTVGWEAAIIVFRNWVDQILQEARGLACTDGFFCMEELDQYSMVSAADCRALEDVDEDGDYEQATSLQVVYTARAQGKG